MEAAHVGKRCDPRRFARARHDAKYLSSRTAARSLLPAVVLAALAAALGAGRVGHRAVHYAAAPAYLLGFPAARPNRFQHAPGHSTAYRIGNDQGAPAVRHRARADEAAARETD